MEATLTTYPAPWGIALKAISFFSTVFVIAIANAGIVELTARQGNRLMGLALIILPLGLLVIRAVFTVRGYVLTPNQLTVQRLGWETQIDLHKLVSAEADQDAMTRSLRLFGNGGLFSFTGLFYSRKLGSYRAYATHLKRCVVLRFQEQVIVITPDRPDDLVDQLGVLISR